VFFLCLSFPFCGLFFFFFYCLCSISLSLSHFISKTINYSLCSYDSIYPQFSNTKKISFLKSPLFGVILKFREKWSSESATSRTGNGLTWYSVCGTDLAVCNEKNRPETFKGFEPAMYVPCVCWKVPFDCRAKGVTALFAGYGLRPIFWCSFKI
jgi:hypothetical protein